MTSDQAVIPSDLIETVEFQASVFPERHSTIRTFLLYSWGARVCLVHSHLSGIFTGLQ